jgi:hypothetical protein
MSLLKDKARKQKKKKTNEMMNGVRGRERNRETLKGKKEEIQT